MNRDESRSGWVGDIVLHGSGLRDLSRFGGGGGVVGGEEGRLSVVQMYVRGDRR